jgi:hypothetical protein
MQSMDQLIGATDFYFSDVRRWFPRNPNNLGLFSDLASIGDFHYTED